MNLFKDLGILIKAKEEMIINNKDNRTNYIPSMNIHEHSKNVIGQLCSQSKR